MSPPKILITLLLATATLLGGPQVVYALAAAPDLAVAERLLREGQAKAAYELLIVDELSHSGSEDFDYLLGLAALESGHPDKATLAFERVLAVNPNHAAARLDMGRAFFALGDYEGAKGEFESILKLDPPAAARAVADRYITAIKERSRNSALRTTGYVDVAIGRDTNVNNGPSAAAIYVPLFGVSLALPTASSRLPDNYLSYGAGMEGTFAIDGPWSAVAGLDVRNRSNFKANEFDFLSTEYRAGMQYLQDSNTLRMTLGHNNYDLDGSLFRSIDTFSGDWKHRLSEQTEGSVFFQDSRIRYTQIATRANSSDFFVYGAGITRVYDQGQRTQIFGSAFGGSERATDERPDGDRSLYGARAGVQRALGNEVDLFVLGSYQRSKYEQLNPIFQATREDRQYEVTLGLNWRLNQDWTLRPQAAYLRNDSNLPLNKFNRYDASVTLRRDFR